MYNLDEHTYNFLLQLKDKKFESGKNYRMIIIDKTSYLDTYSFFVMEYETEEKAKEELEKYKSHNHLPIVYEEIQKNEN